MQYFYVIVFWLHFCCFQPIQCPWFNWINLLGPPLALYLWSISQTQTYLGVCRQTADDAGSILRPWYFHLISSICACYVCVFVLILLQISSHLEPMQYSSPSTLKNLPSSWPPVQNMLNGRAAQSSSPIQITQFCCICATYMWAVIDGGCDSMWSPRHLVSHFWLLIELKSTKMLWTVIMTHLYSQTEFETPRKVSHFGWFIILPCFLCH